MISSAGKLHCAIVLGLGVQCTTGVVFAGDERSYTKLSKSQAAVYRQCNPADFNQWYLLDGGDISRILAEIIDMPYDPVTASPATVITASPTTAITEKFWTSIHFLPWAKFWGQNSSP